MKIGFIGYGNMAEALASRWVGKHELFIGGHHPGKAKALAEKLGHGTGSGSDKEAVSFAELVVLATTHQAVFEAIESAGGESAFSGKVLLDINNPVEVDKNDFINKTYDGLSLAEAIAQKIPAADVVKAFNMSAAAF